MSLATIHPQAAMLVEKKFKISKEKYANLVELGYEYRKGGVMDRYTWTKARKVRGSVAYAIVPSETIELLIAGAA